MPVLAFANPADNVNDFTATAAAVARLPLGELEVTTHNNCSTAVAVVNPLAT